MHWVILILRFLLGPNWAGRASVRVTMWGKGGEQNRPASHLLFGRSFLEKLGSPSWRWPQCPWSQWRWWSGLLAGQNAGLPAAIPVAKWPPGSPWPGPSRIAFPPVDGSSFLVARRFSARIS